MKINLINLIALPIIIILLFFFINGCSSNDTTIEKACYDSSNKTYFYPTLKFLSNQPTTGATGVDINFNLHFSICTDYNSGIIYLTSYREEDQTRVTEEVTKSIPAGQWDNDIILTKNFSTHGVYKISAYLTKPNGSSDIPAYTTPEISIADGGNNTFNIIQLSIHDTNNYDPLWPDDNTNNYIGQTIRNNTFMEANTVINTVQSNVDLVTPVLFQTFNDLRDWALYNTYGVPPQDIDTTIPILCGIEDIAQGLVPGTAIGLTFQPTVDHPALAYVLNTRIRHYTNVLYDRTRFTVGAACHELGHARGITGDGAFIKPLHGGEHQNDCLMIYTNNPDNFSAPHFCNNHLRFIRDRFLKK